MSLQSVYALVDLVYVRQLGEVSVAGLAISFQVFFLILALARVVGTTILSRVSQLYGADQIAQARQLFTRYSAVSLVLGGLAAVGAYLAAPAYVAAFTDDPAVFREGLICLQVTSLTFLSQLLLIVFGDGMRASGDFMTPMKLMAGSVVLNLILDPALIFGLGPVPAMGLAGAAWATVISQLMPVLLYCWIFSRTHTGRELRWVRGGRGEHIFKEMLIRGLPSGVQFLLISAVLGLVLWAMKPHGAAWTATAGGGFRVIQQCFLPIVAISSAASAIAGQNLGARHIDRVWSVSRVVLVWALVYGLAVSIVLFFTGEQVGQLFLKDPAWLPVAGVYFRWSSWTLISVAMLLPATFILQAAGRSILTASAAMGRLALLSVLVAVLVSKGKGPEWVFAVVVLTALLEGAADIGLLVGYLRRVDTEQAPRMG